MTSRREIEYRCDGVTRSARQCRKPATEHFERAGQCVAHYCPQHARGAGAMRLLRPMPWEYETVSHYGKDGQS